MAKKEYTVKLTRHTTPLPAGYHYPYEYSLKLLAGLVQKAREKEKGLGESEVIEHPSSIQPNPETVSFSM